MAAALGHLGRLAEEAPLDVSRVLVLGHSAGGQLALAACCRDTAVRPSLCVSVASVPDMLPGYAAKLSDEGDAIERYMGFHPDSEGRRALYEEASLSSRLPLPMPVLLVSGSEDVDVPPGLLRDFAEACGADLLEVYGADHYSLVTAGSGAWREVARRIVRQLQDCGWRLPPQPEDYGVSAERGFLPFPDPPRSCAAGLASEHSAAEALLSAWEVNSNDDNKYVCVYIYIYIYNLHPP